MPVIGLDLMGGDTPAPELYAALVKLLDKKKLAFSLAVFGTPSILKKYSKALDADFIPVKSFIDLDEDPIQAVRAKKKCSTNVAMQMLKNQKIDALVSIGNTGALLASAKLHLDALKYLTRPGLLALMPTKKHPLAVIDVGANVVSKPEHLVQFAKMGMAYQKTLGRKNPQVGLLNIGREAGKGRKELREAHKKLKRSLKSNFVGNVEPCDAFEGLVDVLVTDGFTGNIFLKTAEGLSNWLVAKSDQTAMPDSYPGAILCGIKQLVIKCHSYSSAESIAYGICGAHELLSKNFIPHLKSQLA